MILTLIAVASNSAYGRDYFNNLITTPEIDRRTHTAKENCKRFGAYPSSPEDVVYWQETPESEKRFLKGLKLDYLKQVEVQAKQAQLDYFVRQENARLYIKNQEYQRKFKAIQREEERKHYAWCREQRHISKTRAPLPESPEEVVTWDESSPMQYHRNSRSNISHHIKIAWAEASTSTEASSNDSSVMSEDLLHVSSINQDFRPEHGASNKENQESPTQLITQTPQKRSHDAMTSQKQTSQRAATSESGKDSTSIDGSTQYSLKLSINPTFARDEIKSPLRKQLRGTSRTPLFPLI